MSSLSRAEILFGIDAFVLIAPFSVSGAFGGVTVVRFIFCDQNHRKNSGPENPLEQTHRRTEHSKKVSSFRIVKAALAGRMQAFGWSFT